MPVSSTSTVSSTRIPWFSAMGAIFAGLAVACGAFAAHSLEQVFAKQYAGQTRTVGGQELAAGYKYLADFKTGAEYQMAHGLALLALASLRPGAWKTAAGISFCVGIVFFSGSLYALTLSGVRWLGAITPIGGVGFLVGWICIAIHLMKTTSASGEGPRSH
jgi:uncharacterized membrane protein YgdD (TMEM256/DUF423 family)